MLVVTRKLNQTIVIAGPCEVKVLKIDGNKVRIGVYADKQVGIVRGELPREQEKGAA